MNGLVQYLLSLKHLILIQQLLGRTKQSFGLTAGIQSLDEKECEEWINRIEAGNLYVNRGITGAIVNRQPFGGWKRSAVGPNAKAGGLNYVNTLRNWPRVTNVEAAILWCEHMVEQKLVHKQSIDQWSHC